MLPFLAAPVAVYVSSDPAKVVGPAISAYGLAIVCFLVGSWWGIALLRRNQVVLIASNLMVIAGVCGLLLLSLRANLILQALLLVGTIVFERTYPMFRPQPEYYATLRMRLSVIASVSLLLSVPFL